MNTTILWRFLCETSRQSQETQFFFRGRGSVVGRWDVFDLAVPIVFHMILSNIFSKCSHSVSIMLPVCPQLSQMFFKWYSEGYVNLFMKFVCLFVFVCCVEISQTTTPLVAFFVLLESPQWDEVHQIGFIMFQRMLEKLLNIV